MIIFHRTENREIGSRFKRNPSSWNAHRAERALEIADYRWNKVTGGRVTQGYPGTLDPATHFHFSIRATPRRTRASAFPSSPTEWSTKPVNHETQPTVRGSRSKVKVRLRTETETQRYRDTQRERERERIRNRAMRCRRETKFEVFSSVVGWPGCAWYVEQSWEKIVGRINEKGGLGPRNFEFSELWNEKERERETMKRNNFKSIRKKEVSEKLGERPPPWNYRSTSS